MEQDPNTEKDQVLIAKNNETGETGAVKGLKQDGTPDMTASKTAGLSDLVVFNIHKNPLEAFLSNFVRQCKNPSMFGFYKVDADTVNSVGPVVEDALKDPDKNKELLAEAKVEVKAENRRSHAIDEAKINWQELKDKWGIDRDALEKSGDLREMLHNRKSRLVTITPTFYGRKTEAAARLSFRADADGNIKVIPYFIRKEPDLSQEFKGVKFTDEDKHNLLTTGNLGRLADVVDKETGEVVPSFVSIDRMTNELLSVPAKQIYVKKTVGQTELSMAEIGILKSGKAIPDKKITDRNGKEHTVTLQINADKRDIEFVNVSKPQKQSTWLTEDGRIRPITKWSGVPMSEQQQSDYVAGKTVVLENMVDKEGKPCTVYLTFNREKQRPNTSYKDPRNAQDITPANESRTQMAVNNDGRTDEATKKIREPLDRGQTAPKNEEQKRKTKGRKM